MVCSCTEKQTRLNDANLPPVRLRAPREKPSRFPGQHDLGRLLLQHWGTSGSGPRHGHHLLHRDRLARTQARLSKAGPHGLDFITTMLPSPHYFLCKPLAAQLRLIYLRLVHLHDGKFW